MKRQYGIIRTFPNTYTSDGIVDLRLNTRAFTLVNKGTANILLYGGTIEFLLEPTESITFGGYDDSIRSDEVIFSFSGAGTKKLVSLQDVIMLQPNYIEIPKTSR